VPDDPVSAEEVAHRRFSYAFRGFDPGEVREYLDRVAAELRTSVKRERELQRRLADAEHRAAHPVIDEEVLTRSLGEETSRILASAHDVARELKSKAEENAARILRDAHVEAQRTRASAEVVLAERSEEAEQAAEQIRQTARSEMDAAVAQARQEAKAVVAEAEEQALRRAKEAEASSARVVKELVRRRRIAHAQVEQLLAGRERLLEAYRVVHRTLEEVGGELQRAEPEARLATEAVARRTGIDLEGVGDADDVDLTSEAEGPTSVSVAADTAMALARSHLVEPEPDVAPAPASVGAADVPDEAVLQGDDARSAATAPESGAPQSTAPQSTAPQSTAPQSTAQQSTAAESTAPESTAPESRAPAPAARLRIDERPSEIAEDPEPEPEPEAGIPTDAPSAVAELFARIRAGRGTATAEPEEGPGRNGDVRRPADVRQPDVGRDTGARDTGAMGETAPMESDQVEGAGPDGGDDEAALKRRDAALETTRSRLSRKLKRALQDEQNEVLDRLRSHRGRPSVDLLPSSADQAARYERTSGEPLEEAAVAGSRFVSPGVSITPGIGDLAEGLAESLSVPLRRRLERGLAEENGDDATASAERISAAYREWKTQHVDRLAGDAIISAFSRGAVQAAEGKLLRWIVDDDGGPCPDCDDNALAGPTLSGDAYPTGQEHPPAHAGCRCLLVPASP
jgi:DivIVA domain-containing protein